MTKNQRQMPESESPPLAGQSAICFVRKQRGVPFGRKLCEGDAFFLDDSHATS